MSQQELQIQDTPHGDKDAFQAITAYLLERVEEFRQLCVLRKKGWDNIEGDAFFAKQRAKADQLNPPDSYTAQFFYNMMQKIGEDLQTQLGAFDAPTAGRTQAQLLDMCMAPGGFLCTMLRYNPGAQATAYTLPVALGGHYILLPPQDNVTVKEMDITMLAADMGAHDIPEDHPEYNSFLPKELDEHKRFDIVLCDGQVLRTHQRAEYREVRESRRLICTQLALGLEHLADGGTMIILLHKIEAPDTVELLYTFSQFSNVKVYKHAKHHAKRSSFYLVATQIQATHQKAATAVHKWKESWRIATFGDEEDYNELTRKDADWAEKTLEEFGTDLADLGREIWKTQSIALADAPFINDRKKYQPSFKNRRGTYSKRV